MTEEMKKAMKKFAEAANEMVELWDDETYETRCNLEDEYPFDKSFDEIASEIATFVKWTTDDE